MATAMAMMVVDVIEKEVTNATYVVIALVMVAVGREVVDHAAAAAAAAVEVEMVEMGGGVGGHTWPMNNLRTAQRLRWW